MYCGRADAVPMTSCDRAPAVCAINVVATALPLVTPSSDSAARREMDIVTPPSVNIVHPVQQHSFYQCAWPLHYRLLYHMEVRVRAGYCRLASLSNTASIWPSDKMLP